MDAAQNRRKKVRHYAETVRRIVYKHLLFYYRCFLLHFVLGVTVCAVLYCFCFRLEAFLSEGGLSDMLRASVYDQRRPAVTDREAVSVGVLGMAVYINGEPHDDLSGAYFSDGAEKPMTETGERLQSEPDILSEPDMLSEPDAPLDARGAVTDAEERERLYVYDRAAVKDGQCAVIPMDLSSGSLYTEENGGILFSNQTSYRVNAQAFLSRTYPIDAAAVMTASLGTDEKAPLVLILHTHGTESYAPDGAAAVDENYHARSGNTDENVVSVGETLAAVLEHAGISVLHCTTMFDADSYMDSYVRAAAYIKETVAAYPSIRYVFDVHRDALASASGDIIRPVTEIDGEVCAQVMCVVGTDEKGADHADWQDNLTVAVHLQKRLNERYTAFARPINIRSAAFNEQYAPGSILLEIGSSGNSVEEARSAAFYLGCVLAEMITEGNGAKD
ncbi:MAG: stage II sporulation protein P [Eubacteriales bacterium]